MPLSLCVVGSDSAAKQSPCRLLIPFPCNPPPIRTHACRHASHISYLNLTASAVEGTHGSGLGGRGGVSRGGRSRGGVHGRGRGAARSAGVGACGSRSGVRRGAGRGRGVSRGGARNGEQEGLGNHFLLCVPLRVCLARIQRRELPRTRTYTQSRVRRTCKCGGKGLSALRVIFFHSVADKSFFTHSASVRFFLAVARGNPVIQTHEPCSP